MGYILRLNKEVSAKLYQAYRVSVVKIRAGKWQERIQQSLDEVEAVRGYLTDDEVRTVCEQTKVLLEQLKAYGDLVSEDGTRFELFEENKMNQELAQNSREMQAFAKKISSEAKMRMSQGMSQAQQVDKEALLDRLSQKSAADVDPAASDALELLVDLSNVFTEELSQDFDFSNCEVVETAINRLSEPAESNNSEELYVAIRTVLRVGRAIEAMEGCGCHDDQPDEGNQNE